MRIITDNLFAVSLTHNADDLPATIDAPMLYPPFKAFVACTLLPSLAMPLTLLHGWAMARCFYTGTWPRSTNVPKFEQRVVPEYVVYKRTYDHTHKKILETHITQDSDELRTALRVVGSVRGEYVDDNIGNSWVVLERRMINKGYMFRRERWTWAAISDLVRYAIPCTICWLFFPSMRRFHIDLAAWWRGAMPWIQIRHPVTNFFMSVNDYNKAKLRITARHKIDMPATAKPWTPIQGA